MLSTIIILTYVCNVIIYGSLVNVIQHQEYQENEESSKEESESNESAEPQANEEQAEEVNGEESVEEEEEKPKQEEEAESPPFISTDDGIDDLLVCVGYKIMFCMHVCEVGLIKYTFVYLCRVLMK